MTNENATLERIIPDDMQDGAELDKRSLQLHYERYRFAANELQPGRILDIACGAGYGTYLLADTISNNEVTGVDISADAIAYARKRYDHPRVRFIEQDVFAFTGTSLFNTVVSLETIEHLPNPDRFADRLYNLLQPGGILIVSAPVTPSTDANPFHVNDFSPASFRRLFNKYNYKETGALLQVQPFGLKDITGQNKSKRTSEIRHNKVGYYLSHPRVFWMRVKSVLTDGFNNKYLTLVLQKEK